MALAALAGALCAPALPAQQAQPLTLALRRAATASETALAAGSADTLRQRWGDRLRGDPDDVLAALALADLDRLAYRHPEALERFNQVAAGAGPAATVERAHAALGRARTLAQMWRTAEARDAFRRAADVARGAGTPELAAAALLELAPLSARSAGLDRALSLVDEAESLTPYADTLLLAAARCTRGSILVRTGDADAVRLASEGRALARAVGSGRVEAACVMVRVQDLERRGRAREAFDWLAAAVDLGRRTANWSAIAAARQWSAYIFTTFGQFGVALDQYGEAIRYAQLSNNRSALAWSWLGLGDLAMRLDEPAVAWGHLMRAQEAFADLDDAWGRSILRSLEADAANAAGADERARALYLESLESDRTANPSHAVTVLGRLAGLDLRAGRVDDAERRYRESHALAERTRLGGVADLDRAYDLGVLALARNRHDAAAEHFRAFMELVPPRGFTDQLLFDARVRLAEALAGAGRLAEAEAELTAATRNLDAWRATLEDPGLRVAVLQARRHDFDPDLGIATVIARLAQDRSVPAAFGLAERFRARHLLERLVARRTLFDTRRPEIDDSPTPGADRTGGFADARAAEPVDLAALQGALPSGWAMVYYVTGRGDPTTVFGITRDTAVATVLPPGAWEDTDVLRLASLLESGADPTELSARLGRDLLAPVLEPLGADVERLVLVPDGALHRLPFDALRLGDGIVLDRFATSLAPSASFFAVQRTRPSPPAAAGVLAFGDPDVERVTGDDGRLRSSRMELLDDPSGTGAAPAMRLSGSRREARAVGRFATTATVLVGPDASETELKRHARRPWSVVHLATHALVADRSLLGTALLLAPTASDDGYVYPEELSALDLRAELVVLSACRTAGGSVLAGEGVQGLTAPLLEGGGVRAVVASYWPLDDRRTVRLIERMYAGLAAGASTADALRDAKLASRARGASPALWASLTLVGDPAAAPSLEAPQQAWSLPAALLLVAAILAGWLARTVLRPGRHAHPLEAGRGPSRRDAQRPWK